MSSMRLLQTGRQYVLPPITLGVPPDPGHTLQVLVGHDELNSLIPYSSFCMDGALRCSIQ
jgi:hypothetical protein